MTALHFDITADCGPAESALSTIDRGIDRLSGKSATLGVEVQGAPQAVRQLSAVGDAAQAASNDVKLGADTREISAAQKSVVGLRAEVQGMSRDLGAVGGLDVGVSGGGEVRQMAASVRGLGGAFESASAGMEKFASSGSRASGVGSAIERDMSRAAKATSGLESGLGGVDKAAERASARFEKIAAMASKAGEEAINAQAMYDSSLAGATMVYKPSQALPMPSSAGAPLGPMSGGTSGMRGGTGMRSPLSQTGAAKDRVVTRAGYRDDAAENALGRGAEPPDRRPPGGSGGGGPPTGGSRHRGFAGSGRPEEPGAGDKEPFKAEGLGGGDGFAMPMMAGVYAGAIEEMVAGGAGLIGVMETVKQVPVLAAAATRAMNALDQGIRSTGNAAAAAGMAGFAALGQALRPLGAELGAIGVQNMGIALGAAGTLAQEATTALKGLEPAVGPSIKGLTSTVGGLMEGLSSPQAAQSATELGNTLQNPANVQGLSNLTSAAVTMGGGVAQALSDIVGVVGGITGDSPTGLGALIGGVGGAMKGGAGMGMAGAGIGGLVAHAISSDQAEGKSPTDDITSILGGAGAANVGMKIAGKKGLLGAEAEMAEKTAKFGPAALLAGAVAAYGLEQAGSAVGPKTGGAISGALDAGGALAMLAMPFGPEAALIAGGVGLVGGGIVGALTADDSQQTSDKAKPEAVRSKAAADVAASRADPTDLAKAQQAQFAQQVAGVYSQKYGAPGAVFGGPSLTTTSGGASLPHPGGGSAGGPASAAQADKLDRLMAASSSPGSSGGGGMPSMPSSLSGLSGGGGAPGIPPNGVPLPGGTGGMPASPIPGVGGGGGVPFIGQAGGSEGQGAGEWTATGGGWFGPGGVPIIDNTAFPTGYGQSSIGGPAPSDAPPSAPPPRQPPSSGNNFFGGPGGFGSPVPPHTGPGSGGGPATAAQVDKLNSLMASSPSDGGGIPPNGVPAPGPDGVGMPASPIPGVGGGGGVPFVGHAGGSEGQGAGSWTATGPGWSTPGGAPLIDNTAFPGGYGGSAPSASSAGGGGGQASTPANLGGDPNLRVTPEGPQSGRPGPPTGPSTTGSQGVGPGQMGFGVNGVPQGFGPPSLSPQAPGPNPMPDQSVNGVAPGSVFMGPTLDTGPNAAVPNMSFYGPQAMSNPATAGHGLAGLMTGKAMTDVGHPSMNAHQGPTSTGGRSMTLAGPQSSTSASQTALGLSGLAALTAATNNNATATAHATQQNTALAQSQTQVAQNAANTSQATQSNTQSQNANNSAQSQQQSQNSSLSQSQSQVSQTANTAAASQSTLSQSLDATAQSATGLGTSAQAASAPAAQMSTDVGASVSNATAALSNAGPSMSATAGSVGASAMGSMAAGISSNASAPSSAASSAASGAASAAASASDSQSPSKVWIGLGKNMTDGLAIGITNGTGSGAAAAVSAIGGVTDAAQAVASDNGLMVGYRYVKSIITGAEAVIQTSQFQQLGFPQIQGANAKAALGALGLMGAAGSGAQSYKLEAKEKSFGSGTAALPTPPPITVNVNLDGHPFDQKIITANNALLTALTNSLSQQRAA